MTGHHLHIPADADLTVTVDPTVRDDWTHTGLRVIAPAPGSTVDLGADATAGTELMLVPLSGSFDVTVDGAAHHLAGRDSVFAAATDVLYAGTGAQVSVTAVSAGDTGARLAVASAVTDAHHPTAYIAAADVPVEVRGGGDMTRVVRNFGTVGSFDACGSIIACEVVTPGGNWSSYPAHKHDEHTDTESELEEIYYYEISDGPSGTPGFGYHQTSSSPATDPDHPVDTLVEVHTGDVVLVPSGWHGPCAAAPGHDMYYLNVMAGPDAERAWNITDHPDQGWVRGTWEDAPADPRVDDFR